MDSGLGPDRCSQIRLASADAMEWIGEIVAERSRQPRCVWTPINIVALATVVLNAVRRDV